MQYDDALDLAQKLNLAGVIETSAKTENAATREDINDCFRIVALNIYQRLPQSGDAKVQELKEDSGGHSTSCEENMLYRNLPSNYQESMFCNEYTSSELSNLRLLKKPREEDESSSLSCCQP